MSTFSIAVHGGAGTILRDQMTPEREQAHRRSLGAALDAGFEVLQQGGSAVNAAKASVICLENDPLFNAGRGSVFTNKGEHEMDAAIMDGKTQKAGAVAAVRNVRNPIELAWKVMESSEHVFLSGEGASEFAKLQDVPFEPDDYFFSQFRYDQWKAISHSGDYALDHSAPGGAGGDAATGDRKFGTVGAVACDSHGNLAAATSTGGMTNKLYGRIGDTPLIGCGTYAKNDTCAISCTGHGELFIRAVAAYDVSCLMEYRGCSLDEAMSIVVNKKLVALGGEGGMIGVDAAGHVAMQFNSQGMYRGSRSNHGSAIIDIYR
ncbi:MAG TPA: isoaspartyl peptidase/L-asparaginase [Puia sp.]|nr:isoaspartyl peptidase/L-asparaginase [Puia sp.]